MLLKLGLFIFFNYQLVCEGKRRLAIYSDDDDTEIKWTFTAPLGSNLFFSCRILNDETAETDNSIAWGRPPPNTTLSIEQIKDQVLNKWESNTTVPAHDLTIKFVPFGQNDRSPYYCYSRRYRLFEWFFLLVEDSYDASFSCPRTKFRCPGAKVCIVGHYVCDGKPHCSNGADEDPDLCSHTPCLGKIECDEGRCIPTSWCCDVRRDPDCTVVYRHACCPPLDDEYEVYRTIHSDQETSSKEHSMRFLFIVICVISAIVSFIFFLFILSRICIYYRRTSAVSSATFCSHAECAMWRRVDGDAQCRYRPAAASPVLLSELGSSTQIEVSDRPPTYSQVMSSSKTGFSEEPPPSYDTAKRQNCQNAPSQQEPPSANTAGNVAGAATDIAIDVVSQALSRSMFTCCSHGCDCDCNCDPDCDCDCF